MRKNWIETRIFFVTFNWVVYPIASRIVKYSCIFTYGWHSIADLISASQYYRGVNSFLKLGGGQIVMRRASAPSILPKSVGGGCNCPPAPPPFFDAPVIITRIMRWQFSNNGIDNRSNQHLSYRTNIYFPK